MKRTLTAEDWAYEFLYGMACIEYSELPAEAQALVDDMYKRGEAVAIAEWRKHHEKEVA